MPGNQLNTPIAGLHHVTAISGPAQENLEFYTAHLRQRLVKQTVNFDAPTMYHLYYGNAEAQPGSILTFFNREDRSYGRSGRGMARSFAYGVAPAAIEGWKSQLKASETERFGARILLAQDPHGQAFELVADETARDVPESFHSVTLWLDDPFPTARLLTDIFGYSEVGEAHEDGGSRLRMALPGDAPGQVVDLWRSDAAQPARPGPGTIHHVAFRARDNDHQDDLREALLTRGERVTERKDRNYFNAIYFREPGGVLFEIATDPPGFAVDEPAEALGQTLQLPPQYEARRARIEAELPPLNLPPTV